MSKFEVRSPALEIGQVFEDMIGQMHTRMVMERGNLLAGVKLDGLAGVVLNESADGLATVGNARDRSGSREL